MTGSPTDAIPNGKYGELHLTIFVPWSGFWNAQVAEVLLPPLMRWGQAGPSPIPIET